MYFIMAAAPVASGIVSELGCSCPFVSIMNRIVSFLFLSFLLYRRGAYVERPLPFADSASFELLAVRIKLLSTRRTRSLEIDKFITIYLRPDREPGENIWPVL